MKKQRVRAPSPRLISLAVASCFIAELAVANPTGPSVVSGAASFNTVGRTLTVTNSPNAIINWRGFSIGAGELTRFQQQSASSAVLNRVVGQDPSAILGSLSSNGRVFLINPNGILFGQGSRIDVAGLVASTLNLSDPDFLAGRLNFQAGAIANPIVNHGEIASAAGGRIYLIAPEVQNHGLITSPSGEVVLAAGKTVKLVDADVPNLQVEVQAGGEALNVGQIIAQGGKAGVYAALINQRGIVRADSVSRDATGRIVFKASETTILDAGSVTSAAGAKGGEIQVLGNQVGLVGDARVDASGEAGGGTVLIGGDFQGKNAAVPNAFRTYFGKDAMISADAITSGDGGKVILWSDDATRAYGTISARGGVQSGNGGFVEVSGKRWLDFTARVNTLAAKGTSGTLLLDPADITINDSATSDGGFSGGIFSTPSSATANVNWSDIDSQLSGNANVYVTTAGSGSGNGDLTVATAHTYTSGNILWLLAGRHLTVNGAIENQGSAGIHLLAGWDGNVPTPTPDVTAGVGNLNINQSVQAGQFVSLRAGNNIVIDGATNITIKAASSAPGLTSVTLFTPTGGGSITRAPGVGITTITAQASPGDAGPASVSIFGNSGITLNNTNINAIAGSTFSISPGGAASVSLTSDNGSISVNGGTISALGGDGGSGGAATVQISGKTGVTVDATSIGATGGLTASSGGSPDSEISLTSTSGAIVVQNSSSLTATGGDTDQSTGAGSATVTLNAFTNLTIADSTVSAQGGNAIGSPPGANAPGADALITLISGGILTISGVSTSITAVGGNGGDGAALGLPEVGGAGGAASVSGSSASDTIITDASISATGGAGGVGGASSSETTAAVGGAGGAASITLTGGAGSQVIVTSAAVSATGGSGGAGGANSDSSFPGGLGGDGGAGGAGFINFSSDSHATLTSASFSAQGGNGGAGGSSSLLAPGAPGVAGAATLAVSSALGDVTVQSASVMDTIGTGNATTTLEAGDTLTVEGSGTQVKADASAGALGTVTLKGVTEVKVRSSALIEAKGGTLATVEINPAAAGADVTITDSTISAVGSSPGFGTGGSAKVLIKGTSTIAATNSTIGAQGGAGDSDHGNATVDVSAGSGASLGGGSVSATVPSGGDGVAIVYVNATSGNIVSSTAITADGPAGTALTGEGSFTGSIVLRAPSGFIHDGTLGAAGGVLTVLNGGPGIISLTASDGIGEIGNPIRIDGAPNLILSNTGSIGDISISQITGTLAVASVATTQNANIGGTYAYTAESGDLSLGTAFLPGGAALDAGQNVFFTASGTVFLNAGASIAASANAGSGGEVRLMSGTGVSQNAAAPVTADKLLAIGGSGSVTMGFATNMVNVLAGTASGDFRFRNGQALEVGTVGGVNGISASSPGNSVTVDVHVTSGNLTVSQAVNANGGSSESGAHVNLTAAAGSIAVNSPVTAIGSDSSFFGANASVTLSASGGITVNTTLSATGGNVSGTGSGGNGNVNLFGGNTIDLTGGTLNAAGGLGAGGSDGIGTVHVEVSTFSGNGTPSGDILTNNINAGRVALQQFSTSSVTGNSIKRAAGTIQASELLLEVDHGGATSGGTIGTLAQPMQVQVSKLEAHTHEASAGIFIESLGSDLQIGGLDPAFYAGSVRGVQALAGGDIKIRVNGVLTTASGLVGCGATGGPICAASGNITLNAQEMSFSSGIDAGTGLLTLAPFTTTRDIAITTSAETNTGDNTLTLALFQIQGMTAGTLEIGRSTDTGTLTVASGVNSSAMLAGTLKLAHQNLAINAPINLSGSNANLTLTAGSAVSLAGDLNVGTGTIDASTSTVNPTGVRTIDSTNPGTGFSAATLNIGTSNTLMNASASVDSLDLSGGSLGGSGTVTVNNSMSWSGGDLSGTGKLVIGAAGTLNVTGVSDRFITNGYDLDNLGTVNLTHSGTVFVNGTPTTFVTNSGIWNANQTAAFGEETSGGSFRFTNDALGTVTRTAAGSGAILNVQNDGTLHVQAGTLTIDNRGGFTSTGSFSIDAGAALQFVNVAHTITGSYAAGTGAGTLLLNSTTLNIGANVTIDDAVQIPTGSTFNVNSGSAASLANVTLSGGTLGGGGTATVSNSMDWSGGDLSGTGKLVIGPTGTLNVSGAAVRLITNGYDLDNLGTVNLTHSGTVYATGTPATVVTNSGTWNANQTASFGEEASGGSFLFVNAASGTITRSVTGEGTIFNLQNDGALSVQAGTLTINNFGAFTSAGSFSIDSGAVLTFVSGSHTVNGSFAAGSGAGTLTIAATTLNIGANVTIDDLLQIPVGSTLNVNSGSTATFANLSLGGGTLGGAGATTVSGTFNWTDGSIAGPGIVTADGTMNISGGGTRSLLGGTLKSAGIGSIIGTSLSLSPGAAFVNDVGGTLGLQGTFDIVGGTFDNLGTMNRLDGGTTQVNATGGVFNNSGLVDVQGTASFVQAGGTGTHSGTFNVASGATLQLSGGPSAVYDLTGATSITGSGTVNFDSTSTVGGSVAAGAINVSGGTLNLNSTTMTGSLNISGGSVGGTGDLTVTTDFSQTAGTLGSSFNSLSITQASGDLNAAGFGATNALSLTASSGDVNVTSPISTGGNITLEAQGAGSNVNVSANITKASGADATLTVRAAGDIAFSAGADVTSTSNKLHVILNADRDANGAGAIKLGSGTVVTSNGGNVTLGGGADPLITAARGNAGMNIGVHLDGAQLLAGGGNVNVRGQGHNGTSNNDGVRLENSSVISSAGGAITITGTGGAGSSSDNVGIRISGSGTEIHTVGAGNIVLTGQGGAGLNNNHGVRLESGALVTSAGAVSITGNGAGIGTGNGGLEQAGGSIVADGLELIGTGAFNLNQAGNEVNTIAANIIGGSASLTYRDATALAIGTVLGTSGVSVSGPVTLITGGAITQTAPMVAGGAASLNAGANPITLTNAGNDFGGAVSLTGSSASIKDASGLDLGTVAVGAGALDVNATGPITQSGPIGAGTASFSAGANPITLTNASNDFSGAVSLNNSGANNVAIREANALILGTSSVGNGTLVVVAGGTITQTGPIVQAAGAGDTQFTSTSGAAITLTNGGNDFTGPVDLDTTGSATITDANSFIIKGGGGGGGASASLTINANGTVSQSGAFTGTAPAVVVINAGSGPILLDDPANNFSGNTSVAATTTGAASLVNQNAGGINLAASSVGGALSLTSGGPVTQTGAITVGGTSNIHAGANAITLTDGSNDFGGAVSLTGTNVSITDANTLTLGAVNATNLTANATAIGQNAAGVVVTGTSALIANSITLNSANDFGTVDVASSGNVSLTDANSISIGNATVGGTFDIVAASTSFLNGFSASNYTFSGGVYTLAAGTYNLGGTTTISGSASVTASGATLNAAGGTMNVSGTFTAFGGTVIVGTLNVLAGGLLSGTGTITGNVNNSAGTVSPGASPGILTINGNYTQGLNGVLEMQIGGLTPGQYDQLAVSGSASLGGTLNTALINSFVPPPGSTYTLVNALGGVSGTFSTINQPPTTLFNNFYGPTTFEFIAVGGGTAVPAPIAPTFNYTVTTTEQLSQPLIELIDTIVVTYITPAVIVTAEGQIVPKPPSCN